MASALPHLCFLLPLLLLLPLSTIAQTNRNVSLGSSLYALNDSSSWASPSGDFAFGFRPVDTNGFLLAIWFDKIPEKTMVWSANRDKLVARGSKAELTTDGRLVLNDPQGSEIWGADSIKGGVSYAAMLDTGNFVLASRDSVIIWESFNETTDTILPTQILVRDSRLVSRLSEMDYSSGRFQLRLQLDGNLVLYTTAFPTDSVYFAYWASMTLETGRQVVFNQSGNIYLTRTNESIFNLTPANTILMGDLYYQRATLDHDGIFAQYVYPKTSRNNGRQPQSWSPLWVMPSNICMRIRGDYGSGACGFNSYCRLDENQRPSCECPPGYSYLDPNNKQNGCKQDFISQSCNNASQEADLFDMRQMANTDWPLSDYEWFQSVNEDWCRESCLMDCFCAVAIFRDRNCWKKKLPLSNGVIDPGVGGKALIKVRRDNSSAGSSGKEDQSPLTTILSWLLGSSVFLNFLLLLAVSLVIFCSHRIRLKKLQPYHAISGINLRCFTYKELEEATNGFKEELGSGAFATVYKGVLEMDKRDLVAVKKLDKLVKQNEQEFNAEVSAIGRTNHKNLVQLLGFCNEGQHRLLVYEFMRNGSLASFLFGSSRPSWYQRVQIASGIARGLNYLHEECSSQIIHCDIKPQNILLDDYFTAKIADFGLAKLLKTDQTRTTTGIRGTKGYVAPEWFKNMAVTVKVDVYSYGAMLLEIICCRKNVESEMKDENKVILTDWAYDCYVEKRLDMLVENDEEAKYEMRLLEKFVMIAIWCIQDDPSLRPTMKKVTQMLEGAVEVLAPPNPSSFNGSTG